MELLPIKHGSSKGLSGKFGTKLKCLYFENYLMDLIQILEDESEYCTKFFYQRLRIILTLFERASGQFGPGQFAPGQFGPNNSVPGQFGPGQFGPGQFGPRSLLK